LGQKIQFHLSVSAFTYRVTCSWLKLSIQFRQNNNHKQKELKDQHTSENYSLFPISRVVFYSRSFTSDSYFQCNVLEFFQKWWILKFFLSLNYEIKSRKSIKEEKNYSVKSEPRMSYFCVARSFIKKPWMRTWGCLVPCWGLGSSIIPP
jgi:hypothetical protein